MHDVHDVTYNTAGGGGLKFFSRKKNVEHITVCVIVFGQTNDFRFFFYLGERRQVILYRIYW